MSTGSDLSEGAIFKSGVELARIDVIDYELAVTRLDDWGPSDNGAGLPASPFRTDRDPR